MEKILEGLRKRRIFKGYYIISSKSFFKKISPKLNKLALSAMYFLLGALICRGNFLTDYYPFGVSYISAVPSSALWISFFGTMIGYFMFSGAGNSLAYIAVCVAAAGIRWALSDLKKISRSEFFPLGNAFFSVCFTKLTLMLTSGGFEWESLLYMFIEGTLSAGGAYFLNMFFKALKENENGIFSDKSAIIGLAVSVSLFLLPFAGGTMDAFSYGRCFIIFLIILSAYCFGEASGAIAGICACVILTAGSDEASYVALAYSIAGLVCGIFGNLGKLAAASSFIIVNIIFSLILSGQAYLTVITGEAVAAGLVFLLVPSKLLNIMRFNIENSKNKVSVALANNGDTVKRLTAAKLQYASKAFGDIGGYIEQVYDKMERLSPSGGTDLCGKIKKEVCGACSSRQICNKEHTQELNSAFSEIGDILKESTEVSEENIPDFFRNSCVKKANVVNLMNREYLNIISKEDIKRRSNEIRTAVTEQFEGTGRLLEDLSEEISSFADYDSELSEKIEKRLKQSGINTGEVVCRKSGKDILTVELFSCSARASDVFKGRVGGVLIKGGGILSSEIKRIIEEVTGKMFDTPFVYPEKNGMLFRATTKTDYSIDFGISQHSRKNGRFCGDSYDFFSDGSGNAILLISDGMGTGGRAAVDSTMATAVFTRLIKAGIGFDNALNAVNNALMVKSDDESLATVDVARINLFSGKTEFLKAGAPFGFIKRGEDIRRIECDSLPVGILKNIDFVRKETGLNAGDMVIMISDGAASFADLIEKKIKSFKGGCAQDLSEDIMNTILSGLEPEQDDDITILIGVLKDNIPSEYKKTA